MEIIEKLPHVGNHINQLSLTRKTIQKINSIFLNHYETHFHNRLHLKSLKDVS